VTPQESRRAFAALIADARKRQHFSVREVARIADVPPATVQGWLAGKHFPVPALRQNYLRMAQHLGLADKVPDDLWDDSWTDVRPKLRTGRPPYLGLRPFGARDRDLFFGRAAEARRLADAVLAMHQADGHGLIAVLGASGVGKSSLLAAGLVGTQTVDGVLAGWTVAQLSVGELAEAAPQSAQLVVIDQFEELFDRPEVDFASAMGALGQLSADRVVVIGLRADAFAVASREPVLRDAMSRPFLVSPLTRAEVREVIVGPAKLAGIAVADDLVPVLLDDLDAGPREGAVAAGVLPLLSNALLVTWASGKGGRMTVSDYVRSGGIWSALEGLAEDTYRELGAPQQEAARLLFLRLVRDSGDLVTRASLSLEDLDAAGREAMAPFVDARMLTVSHGAVQISHDALIGNWTRLQDWLHDSRADREVVEKLRRASRVWIDSGRSEHALIPVDRLEVFGEWVADPQLQRLLGPRETEFVAASREHFDSVLTHELRVNSRLRRGRGVAIALTALASALALVAGTMYFRGVGLQAETDAARLEAQSRQVALEARSVRADDPNLMAQMSLVSHRLATTRQSESALLDVTAVNTPLRWLGNRNAVIAKTADDQLVARADGGGEVTIWRGDELLRTPGTTFQADPAGGALFTIALASLDQRVLLAVGGTSAAGLWDVTATPTLLTDLGESGVTVNGASFSGDGSRLALATSTGAVELWSVTAAGATRAGSVSLGADHPARAVAFHPVNGELFVAGLPDAVARFSAGTKPSRLPDLGFAYAATPVISQALAISPDGTQLVAGIAGRRVPRWQVSGAEPVALESLTGLLSWTNDLSFSSDGKTLIAANSDKNTYLFNAASGVLQQTLSGATIDTGAELVDGRPVTSGDDGVLRVWQAHSPVLRTGSTIYAMSTDASAKFLAASSISDGQELWDTTGAEPIRLANPPAGGRSLSAAVAVAPNAAFIVGGTTDGSVLSWPLTASGAGSPTTVDAFPGSYIGALAVASDSSLVAALQYTGTQVALYRADATGALTSVAKLDTPNPQGVTFSPDGKLLAVPIAGGMVQVWDVSTPAAPVLAGRIEGLGALPTIAAFANHSRTLAVGTDAGQVRLWDLSDPAKPVEKQVFGDPHGAVYGVTFSPDDSTLAAVGGDALVWAWRLDGAPSAFLSLDGQLGNTNDVRFINGGARLVAGGDAGTIRVWTARPDAARAELCANRGDVLTADEWSRFLPGVTPQDPC